jgi:hypothetical protein
MKQKCTDPKILEFANKYKWRKLQFLGELNPVYEVKIKGVNLNSGDNIRIRLCMYVRNKFKPDKFRTIYDIMEHGCMN